MFFRRSNKIEDTSSDQELIESYKRTQDNSYVGILYQRYALQIYGICRRYMKDEEECKDTAMQVFEYLLTELLKYDISNFKGWLAWVVRNYCLMQLRKQRSLDKKAEDFKINAGIFVESELSVHPINGESNERLLEKLHGAMVELKPQQRTCVELFYLQDKSYEEVAQTTGFTMNEVKSHIQNGKRNLKIKLGDINE